MRAPYNPASMPDARRLLIATAGSACLALVVSCGNHPSPTPAARLAASASVPTNAHSVGGLASCPTGSPGCGGATPQQPPPDGPAPPHAQSVAAPCADVAVDPHNPMLTPLSADDIQLYLRVMRAAADRVRHPSAADQAAVQHEKRWEATTNANVQQREAAAQAAQANTMATMQNIMAAVNKGDYASAQATARAANAAQQPAAAPAIADAPADSELAFNLMGGHADDAIVAEQHIDAARYARIVDIVEYIVVPPQQDFIADGDGPMQATCPPTARDRAIDAAEARQRALLQPYRDQIRALEAVVRVPLQGP